MDFDDFTHRVHVRETDEVEEAAAQERVGQFLLVVRGDHDDRTLGRLDPPAVGLGTLAGFLSAIAFKLME